MAQAARPSVLAAQDTGTNHSNSERHRSLDLVSFLFSFNMTVLKTKGNSLVYRVKLDLRTTAKQNGAVGEMVQHVKGAGHQA